MNPVIATASLTTELLTILPELILAIGSMLLLVAGVMIKRGAFRVVSMLACILWATAGVTLWMTGLEPGTIARAFSDMVIVDSFAQVVKTLIVLGAIASLVMCLPEFEGTIMGRPEYPTLISLNLVGLFLMVSANDMLSLYVGLELSSLALYVLAAFNRNSARSSEAGLKYFILGALSSGLLLFGISLIYGFTGSTQFDVIAADLSAATLPGPTPIGVIIGMVFILAGMIFKVSAVPFHMWAPDVYDGAPTPVAALFAIVPKVAAIALIIRLCFGPFMPLSADWAQILTFVAGASMIWGAFAGIMQTSLKRLLAYSSIANMGYVLMGVVAGGAAGLSSVVTYLAIYMVTTAGIFAAILSLRRNGVSVERTTDLAGLSRSKPFMAYAMAAMMFSISGIPPLAGFFGKLAVFQAAVSAQMFTLAIIGVVTSVIASYYYLNIIRVMFFENLPEETPPMDAGLAKAPAVILAFSLIFTVVFIFAPDVLNAFSAYATQLLLE